ncbi:MAG: cupin domain-containing protein [Gammaproteobacteria bacterium]|nr:cupin domain-containing protein [Gammaproteobacteria bacterium]
MKLAIMCAFIDELRDLVDLLLEVSSLPAYEEIEYAKRKCLHIKAFGHDIYITLSGIGTTSAGNTTTALCETIKPDCIIMCGTAGGLIAGQKTGDLVVSNSVIDIDLFSLREFLTGTPYEPCLTDPHSGKPIEREYSPHPLLLEIFASSSLINVTKGIIATSNTFPAPKEAFELIKKLNCAGIEMESSGVFKAANHYDIPVIAVRAISNSLDDEGNDLKTPDDAINRCSERLTAYLLDLLPRINTFEPIVAEKRQQKIEALVAKYALAKHEAGGYFKSETIMLPHNDASLRDRGEIREAGSSTMLLLAKYDYSAWRLTESDETWNYHQGDTLMLRVIDPISHRVDQVLLDGDELFQYTIPSGYVISAESLGDYSIIGCMFSPSLSFEHVRFVTLAELLSCLPPEHADLRRLVKEHDISSEAAETHTSPFYTASATDAGETQRTDTEDAVDLGHFN